MSDLISRQDVIDAVFNLSEKVANEMLFIDAIVDEIENISSAEPEPLTDNEQRIFLAAMGREEKVCEEVDRNYVREPYKDSLMSICREIKRKVKGALWT